MVGKADEPLDGSPGNRGILRPFTSPMEREPPALGLTDVKIRPLTSFPATGFDAELQRLESDDAMLRQMAMNNLIAMAKHGGSTERIIAMMVEKLKDSDMLFRGMAVEALSRSAKEVRQQITSALIKSLEDPDANVRCRAVKALRPACVGESNPAVVAALSEMLKDENPFVQDAVIDNLQYAILHASFEVRSSLLSSVHKGIRTAAIDSYMDEILAGGDQALDLVIGMLQDGEFQVRMTAVRVVANLLTTRDTKVTKDHEAKLKAEGREHDNVQLVQAEGPQIVKTLDALMTSLGDKSPDIRTEVLRRLSCNTATLNQKVFKAVLELLADEVH